MTRVAILTVPAEDGGVAYCAVSGEKRSFGDTAGKALDSLTAQLGNQGGGTLVVVQSGSPDPYFGAPEQQRLAELMRRWREARDQGRAWADEEEQELKRLVDLELRASADRAAAISGELGR